MLPGQITRRFFSLHQHAISPKNLHEATFFGLCMKPKVYNYFYQNNTSKQAHFFSGKATIAAANKFNGENITT